MVVACSIDIRMQPKNEADSCGGKNPHTFSWTTLEGENELEKGKGRAQGLVNAEEKHQQVDQTQRLNSGFLTRATLKHESETPTE